MQNNHEMSIHATREIRLIHKYIPKWEYLLKHRLDGNNGITVC